jgi:hypothetical protein
MSLIPQFIHALRTFLWISGLCTIQATLNRAEGQATDGSEHFRTDKPQSVVPELKASNCLSLLSEMLATMG